jgi:hypothetical protein
MAFRVLELYEGASMDSHRLLACFSKSYSLERTKIIVRMHRDRNMCAIV